MKKALKIIGITLLIFVVILATIPFVLESKIDEIVQSYVEKNLNAKVEFEDINLSLFSSFPKANVTIDNLRITNNEPFMDDIFVDAKTIELDMAIKELFKGENDDAIVVDGIYIDEALVTLKLNEAGIANYDIMNADESNTETSEANSSGFMFSIEDYNISNSALTYIDETSKTTIHVNQLNHSGKGSFSDTASELETTSEANVSFTIDSTSYLANNHITLDAIIGLDLEKGIYTFKENKGFINQLPLEFQGSLQQKEAGQFVDITFNNPESSFKDFLAVIPEAYSKNLDGVETTGDFKVSGVINGLVSEETIPTLDINMVSNNASFKYPNLPKRVENITVNASLKNDSGKSDDTYVNFNTLNFKIDDDVFKSSATIKNLGKNMLVNANIDGTLNLANISKAYPVKLEKTLSGILKGKLNTAFDMNAIETNAYERIKNNGNIEITNFIFSSEDIVNPIHIANAEMIFNPGKVSLKSFNALTGTSDISATGNITNLLGFLLSDKDLQGKFDVTSKNFVVSDFMEENVAIAEDNKTTDATESLKIPDFLDCTINANAKNVVYDNLNLKNVQGTLLIKDQQATLKNMTSSLFDGKLEIDGYVTTKEKVPSFSMNLGAKAFDISKSFSGLELLQTLAPIANVLQGKLNTTIKLDGNLNEKFTPNLETITGNALAEVLTSTVNPLQGEILEKLSGSLSFIDFSKLNLKDLKTKLSFENGLVSLSPFTIKYDDIDMEVSGTHSFDQVLDYNLIVHVPAKYLGPEVNRLVGSINDSEVNKITIPVTANITGDYKNPKVNTDLQSAVTNLTKQLVEIEKQKLLNKGKDKITDLLGDLLGSEKTKKDSTKKDTTATKDPIKGILGSLLGSKKKQKKDTIN